MKFSRHWKQSVAELPGHLKPWVLNYKKFKKFTKPLGGGIDEFLKELESDVNRINAHWKGLAKGCCVRSHMVVDSEILDYIKLNTKTLYKACKRASKRFRDPRPLQLMGHIKTRRNAGVFGGLVHEIISYKTNGKLKETECPVCFDACDGGSVIMHCGHVICVKCVLGMLGVANRRGTLTNLISHGVHTRKQGVSCPLCRDEYAFYQYKLCGVDNSCML